MGRRGGTEFRGADRRIPSGDARASDAVYANSRNLAVVAGVLLLAVSAAPLIGSIVPGRFPGDGWSIAAASALIGVAATIVWLTCCYVSGRIWPAYVGLSIYPALVMAEVAASPVMGTTHRQLVALASLVPAASAAWLTHRGRRAPEVDTKVRPWRVFAVLTGIISVAIAAGSVVWESGATPALSRAVAIGTGAMAVLFWCFSASECVRARPTVVSYRVGLAMSYLAFGVSAFERIVGVETSSVGLTSWSNASARAAALIGFLLLFTMGVRSLRAAWLIERGRQQTLRMMRDRAARTLEDQTRYIHERGHDLRSLVAGIAGATATLTRYREYLDTTDLRDLERALGSEVARLRRSLADSEQCRPFNLHEAIHPIIVAERTRGSLISENLIDIDVEGSRNSTAAIVQNLITNARSHAAGAAIRVSSDVIDGIVRVAVEDDGPGLPDVVRRHVVELFRLGMTTSADRIAPPRQGDSPRREEEPEHFGLGLTICARLAREQGARLRLADTSRGTRVELLLSPVSSLLGVVP